MSSGLEPGAAHSEAQEPRYQQPDLKALKPGSEDPKRYNLSILSRSTQNKQPPHLLEFAVDFVYDYKRAL